MEPETAISPGGSENEEGTVGNLRDQIGQLESLLLAQKALLEECRQGRSIFEDAAAERLRVIEHGAELLRAGADEIQALRAELGRHASSAAGAAEERMRLESSLREACRGVAEMASRERALTGEILELRHEGLLHSIVRRMSRLFS